MPTKKTKKKPAKKAAKKKGTKKPAAKTKSGANALEFCRAYLRKNKKAAFAEIRDAAAKKGLTLYPISFGRAQALEGIVKSAPYGTRKKTAAKRGPGRPKGSKNKARSGSSRRSNTAGVDGLVSMLKNLERERDDAIAVIEKIRTLVS